MMLHHLVLLGQTPPEDWIRIVTDKGTTIGIGLAVVWVVMRHGPKVIEAVANLIAHLQDVSEQMFAAQQAQGQTLDKVAMIVERKMDPAGDPRFQNHLFSTQRTNRALLSHADAILAFAHAHGEAAEKAVRPHVDEIKRILQA